MNLKNKWILSLLLAIALVFSMLPAVGSVQAKEGAQKDSTCLSPKMVQLQRDMRKAWIDHTIWTRSYIVSAISNLPDQKDVLNRLLQNQQEIGNLIKPYYGQEAANKLADLSKEAILDRIEDCSSCQSGQSSGC